MAAIKAKGAPDLAEHEGRRHAVAYGSFICPVTENAKDKKKKKNAKKSSTAMEPNGVDGGQLGEAEPPHPLPSPSLAPCTYPSIRFVLVFKPMTFPHENTFFLKLENLAEVSFILSCIFSQIRGTPRKAVGFTSCRVLIKVPCNRQSRITQCTWQGARRPAPPTSTFSLLIGPG